MLILGWYSHYKIALIHWSLESIKSNTVRLIVITKRLLVRVKDQKKSQDN